MRIRIDETGNILAYGIDEEITGDNTFDAVNVPADFISTFSIGKYIAPGGKIEEVPEWIAPAIME